MATRYWVGGSGNWGDPTHWSSTSGGGGNDLGYDTEIIPHPINLLSGWGLNLPNGNINNATSFTVTQSNLGIYLPGGLKLGRFYKVVVKATSTENCKISVWSISYSYYSEPISSKVHDYTTYIYVDKQTSIMFYVIYSSIYPNTITIEDLSIQEVLTYPNSSDDVVFDNNSGTGTVTVNTAANMKDLTFSQTQLITLVNAAYSFNIYGNWTLCSNTYLNTSFTSTGNVYLKATTSVNITSNGCTRGWNRIYMDGVGCICNHMDDFVSTSTEFLPANGTWNTNNYNITMGSFNTIGISGTRTLNLGSSYLTFGQFFGHSGYTLNAGTSTIKTTSGRGSGSYLSSGNYYNVEGRNFSIWGTCTFNNLIYLGGIGGLFFGEYGTPNITINGDFNISGGNSSTLRGLVMSSITSVPRTITCNGTVTASNVDFRDIVGAGTANWDLSAIEGGSGDCGGNSGITFTPAQTQYFKHTSGAVNWSDATKWFSNYERTIQGRVPLPQDDAIFDENSFTGASTLTMNVTRIGKSLDMSAINQSVIVTLSNSIECYGSFILGNNITLSGGYSLDLIGNGNYNLNLFNKPKPAYINVKRGNYTSLSDIILVSEAANQFSVQNSASFDFNGFNFSGILLYTNTSGTLNLGSGIFEIISNSPVWSGYINIANTTNLISDKSTIIFKTNTNPTNDNPRLYGLNKVFGKVIFSGNTTKSQTVESSCSINELIIAAGKTLKFKNGTTQTIGKLTAIGTPEQIITIGSTTAGSKYTLNITGTEPIETDYINITDCNVTQTNKFYAGFNSINGGNNTNVIFDYVKLPLNMNLYTLKMYDKVLTDDEVLQNYNATKSRYII